jgi:hypothetical protein
MTDWDIGWAGWNQHFEEFKPQTNRANASSKRTKKAAKKGQAHRPDRERARVLHVRPSFQLPRADMPQYEGRVSTQIAAELRSVYAAPICDDLPGADDLLAQIDRWHDELN